MNTVQKEIIELEERLRQAELGPDPNFFEDTLADEVVLFSQDGIAMTKSVVVEAHRPGKGPKFTRVEMSGMKIAVHGVAAVVTCQGLFESPQFTGTLKFMRVWLNRDGRWQIIAASVSK